MQGGGSTDGRHSAAEQEGGGTSGNGLWIHTCSLQQPRDKGDAPKYRQPSPRALNSDITSCKTLAPGLRCQPYNTRIKQSSSQPVIRTAPTRGRGSHLDIARWGSWSAYWAPAARLRSCPRPELPPPPCDKSQSGASRPCAAARHSAEHAAHHGSRVGQAGRYKQRRVQAEQVGTQQQRATKPQPNFCRENSGQKMRLPPQSSPTHK